MQKLIGSILTLACGTALYADNSQHSLSTKYEFRKHTEGNYKYSLHGVKLEYNLNKTNGFNYEASFFSTFNKNNKLMELEQNISQKFPLRDNHSLYPLMGLRFSSHKLYYENEEYAYAHKSAVHLGAGWKYHLNNHISSDIEAGIYKDLKNAFVLKRFNSFKGTYYYNPIGYKAKATIRAKIDSKVSLEVSGQYFSTFQKIYHELSFKIGVNGSF